MISVWVSLNWSWSIWLFIRTMDWSQLWNQKSCWMVSMALTELLRLPRKFGQRFSSTWLRTMCCLRAFCWSLAWSLLVLNARTGPHPSRSPPTLSASSARESPRLSRESWQVSLSLLQNFLHLLVGWTNDDVRIVSLCCVQFLSGGQSEVEATLNLNAMNQSPNPWHVSFSYARALQNTCLKTWGGLPENVQAAQEALLIRAKANSLAQLGKYTAEGESEEAKKGMFVKGYSYWAHYRSQRRVYRWREREREQMKLWGCCYCWFHVLVLTS